MKKFLGLLLMGSLIILFSGCGGGSSSTATSSAGAGGVGAKGPFVQGSYVGAYELNSTTAARISTSADAETNTTDDLGTYALSGLSWSGATEIEIKGYYFDENSGARSTTTASLSAIINIVSGQTVSANVNIFTDLAATRIRYLMENNSSLGLAAAKEQAREDIVNLFDLNISDGVYLEDLDLTDGAHNAAANAELLRVSAAIAQSPDLMDGLRDGIEDGNMTNSDVGAGAFVDLGNLVKDVNLTEVATNLEEQNLTTDAPDSNDTDENASYVDYSETRHVPVLQSIADITVDEDTSASVELNATDEDGDSITLSAISSDTNIANVSISGTTLTITPVENANGEVEISVTASDGELADLKVFRFTLRPVNDAPVISTISNITENEDSSDSNITLFATDADGDSLTFSAVSSNTNIVSISVSGTTLTVHPLPNANGSVDINVTVDDGNGGVDSTVFSVTLNPINDPTVWHNDTTIPAVDEDFTQFTVELNATDVDGPVTYALVSNTGGVVDASVSGSTLTIAPIANANGDANITVSATQDGVSVNHSMTLHVNPINDPTVWHNDTTIPAVDEDFTQFTVELNATDVDGPVTYALVSNTGGVVDASVSGSTLTIVPIANANGDASITVSATQDGTSVNHTMTLHVNPVNDAPVANDSTISAIKNSQYSGTLSASDVDAGDTLTYAIVSDDSNGTVAITDASTGAFTYDPATDFVGDSSFTFKVTDSNGTDSNTATVTIHVVDRVINVTANDDTVTIDEDTNTTIDVLANDTSVFADDGTTASGTIVSAVSTPSHGSATVVSGGVEYVPDANYNGTDTFTYTAQSASGSEDSATVTVTVTSVNDAPVISTISNITENEDSSDSNITLFATDADGDSLTFSAVSSNTNIVSISVSGTTLTVHPLPNANGSVDINVTVDDGNGGVDSTVFSVTLNPINDIPVGDAIPYKTLSQDALYSSVVTATDVDGDLNASGYMLVDSSLSGGQLTFDANGSFTYNPNGVFDHLPYNVYGPDVWFKFTASDSHGGVSDPVTVSFRYVGLNDAPTVDEGFNDATVFTGDEILAAIDSGVFSDVDDNTTLTYTQTGLPAGVTLSSDGIFSGTVTAGPGLYTATITATDEQGASVSDDMLITVNYPAVGSDVNNTAVILSDGTKVVFYPNGQFIAVGIDGNQSFWDDGLWDINDTAHAVQMLSSEGSVDYIYLPHAGVSAGDTLTDRFVDPADPIDERSTLKIIDVIDITGTEADILNGNGPVTSDDVNSTALKIVDGPTINFFANGEFLLIDNDDQSIARVYQQGYWGVENGVLGLFDSNGNSDTNVTFSQSDFVRGTLGYHEESGSEGLLTVQQVIDINPNDPFSNPYAVSASEIEEKVVVFTDGNTIAFNEANSSDAGEYWYKGRGDTGVEKDNGTYQVESNGTITMMSSIDGSISSLTFNSAPAVGTLIVSYYPDDTFDVLVAGQIVSFDNTTDYVSIDFNSIKNRSIKLSEGSTYNFRDNGTFDMSGLSYNNQELYHKQGTWNTNTPLGSSATNVNLTYLDGSTQTIKFNADPLASGTKIGWFDASGNPDGSAVIMSVVDLSTGHAIDTYLEYDQKAVDDIGDSPSANITIGGISYTVVPYANVDTPSGTTVLSIKASFYGEEASLTILNTYTSIVLKVFKSSGEYVGSFGPFNPNDVPEVSGYHDIGNQAFSQ